MIGLLIGLSVFLSVHSVRIFAPSWRAARIADWGENGWKRGFSVLSIAGFLLLLWGYGQARLAPVLLWTPPPAMRPVAALLMLLAFVLLVAAYVPGNGIKARLGHPMVLAIKLWALAHLLVNGRLHAVVLFGSFMVWAALSFRAARRREPPSRAPSALWRTLLAVLIGGVAWAVFAVVLHRRWIGVAPF